MSNIPVVLADSRCQACGLELEGGILVSEIGFSEGAGGRIHVQGTFVSHHASELRKLTRLTSAGLGFRGGVQTSENIKEEGKHASCCRCMLITGRKRIQQVCQQMGILPSVQRGAQRFYSLAVDNKFNRGRRTDHVVASCIYLYSRFEKDALMLIDFSERLQVCLLVDFADGRSTCTSSERRTSNFEVHSTSTKSSPRSTQQSTISALRTASTLATRLRQSHAMPHA